MGRVIIPTSAEAFRSGLVFQPQHAPVPDKYQYDLNTVNQGLALGEHVVGGIYNNAVEPFLKARSAGNAQEKHAADLQAWQNAARGKLGLDELPVRVPFYDQNQANIQRELGRNNTPDMQHAAELALAENKANSAPELRAANQNAPVAAPQMYRRPIIAGTPGLPEHQPQQPIQQAPTQAPTPAQPQFAQDMGGWQQMRQSTGGAPIVPQLPATGVQAQAQQLAGQVPVAHTQAGAQQPAPQAPAPVAANPSPPTVQQSQGSVHVEEGRPYTLPELHALIGLAHRTGDVNDYAAVQKAILNAQLHDAEHNNWQSLFDHALNGGASAKEKTRTELLGLLDKGHGMSELDQSRMRNMESQIAARAEVAANNVQKRPKIIAESGAAPALQGQKIEQGAVKIEGGKLDNQAKQYAPATAAFEAAKRGAEAATAAITAAQAEEKGRAGIDKTKRQTTAIGEDQGIRQQNANANTSKAKSYSRWVDKYQPNQTNVTGGKGSKEWWMQVKDLRDRHRDALGDIAKFSAQEQQAAVDTLANASKTGDLKGAQAGAAAQAKQIIEANPALRAAVAKAALVRKELKQLGDDETLLDLYDASAKEANPQGAKPVPNL